MIRKDQLLWNATYSNTSTICKEKEIYHNFNFLIYDKIKTKNRYGEWDEPSDIWDFNIDSDYDGDGTFNSEELQVGTDPWNPDLYLKSSGVFSNNQSITINYFMLILYSSVRY